MLSNCPECSQTVSTLAFTCPHCGCPLIKQKTSQKYKPKTRMRLPNGFGQISEIKSQNLRNPFRVMIPVGKTPEGRPISKILQPKGYFRTYNEAYAALAAYNANPYNVETAAITVQELYERWSNNAYTKMTPENKAVYELAWRFCSSVYETKVRDIRVRHIKNCMENGKTISRGKETGPSVQTKGKIKTLFAYMLDYAIEYDIVDKNYARSFSVPEEIIEEIRTVKNEHIVYTKEEIDALWRSVDTEEYADFILIQCYSGWRPSELLQLQLKNINLEKGTMFGGMKTEAGKNRIVPVHTIIEPLIRKRYARAEAIGSSTLFFRTQPDKTKYGLEFADHNAFRKYFYNTIHNVGLNDKHRPHDGRKHFVTMAKKYALDEYAIKYIVGHKISDLTERVYTERELDWLKSEMEKIKEPAANA